MNAFSGSRESVASLWLMYPQLSQSCLRCSLVAGSCFLGSEPYDCGAKTRALFCGNGSGATENTRPRLDRCSAHRVRPDRPHRPRSRPVCGPPLRQLASDPSVPVEGGSCNDYDYACGDPVNQFDLDGSRCLTGKNPNGSCRSVTRGARQAVRSNINTPATSFGLGVARANGAKCAGAARGIIVCTEARGGYRRGGTMYGDVFITGASSVTPEMLRHETNHANQYAWFGGGAGFPLAYYAEESISGGGACNRFEQQAGLVGGGYTPPSGYQCNVNLGKYDP
jgi:hypothetical protein